MPIPLRRLLSGSLAGLVLCGALASQAHAHPHVWITVETTVVYENGSFTGLRHKWTFDEFYTAMAIEGLDKNKDGKYDREELAELAKVNIEGLKDFSYFTFAELAGQALKFGEVRDYWLEHKEGLLSLHFTLPLAQPVLSEAKGFTFFVADPTYFIAFDLAKIDPVRLSEGAPAGCKLSLDSPVTEPGGVAGSRQQSSMQLGGFAVRTSKGISINCNGP
jgi:ABC-type uncharacterized transport system substrate-binding protein